ncbi:DUF262 domain-containing protein [Deinococcus sp. RIT780]|uniref:DUF262 domain-containing protein n=1 Tax=Deinococcus sp. RIT780 TaxID=2870472 RepID=UPI001C8948AF|nr:DUF262 domain-containing protein [Deinococcus sp. RIT780]MBX8465003.1 DUF262 domain-containing protein [Deinococcus sp. RIT780]
MTKSKPTNLADKLFPQYSDENENSILDIPPEQRRLHTETYDFSISTIIDYVNNGGIYVPEFQRRYVWSEVQASRLIESLIIQCPVPVIYLNQERDERLSVIDGNQRINSLINFCNNQFELRGLTTYPELDGNDFSSLDPRFQRHILNRTLRCIVISKDTHPQVKFDVFERLNTGSVKLTAQELRHGLYYGAFMEFIKQLANHKKWKSIIITKENRMKSEELILRFFALHARVDNYKKPLTGFLNEYAESNKDLARFDLEKMQKLFEDTISIVIDVYGDIAFKIFDEQNEPVSGFNAALFDAEMVSISRNKIDRNRVTNKSKINFLRDVRNLLAQDEFAGYIGRATSDENAVKNRIASISEIVRRHFV